MLLIRNTNSFVWGNLFWGDLSQGVHVFMHYPICQHGNYLKSKMAAPHYRNNSALTQVIKITWSKILTFGAAILDLRRLLYSDVCEYASQKLNGSSSYFRKIVLLISLPGSTSAYCFISFDMQIRGSHLGFERVGKWTGTIDLLFKKKPLTHTSRYEFPYGKFLFLRDNDLPPFSFKLLFSGWQAKNSKHNQNKSLFMHHYVAHK